jgi:alpha,alpha-trehalose phosphorylase
MWKFSTQIYKAEEQALEESLYMVGNGYIGVRGSFEEGYAAGDSIRGSYINGLYDRVPMTHAEMAFGFPTEQDKQPRIMDTQTCEAWLDGEKAQLIADRYEAYERSIDFKSGENRRSYTYITKSGNRATLVFKRLASVYQTNTFFYVISVVYDGQILLISKCDTAVENYSNAKDPRTGQGHTQLLNKVELESHQHKVYAEMRTNASGLSVGVLISHTVDSKGPFVINHYENMHSIETHISGEGELTLEKRCIFADSIRHKHVKEAVDQYSLAYEGLSYRSFLEKQAVLLGEFWNQSGIEISGAEADQMAIRYMQYELLQSVGVDGFSNVAAKGLSGEGYEGHYFWDTEIYVLPVMLLNQPERAKNLLAYRYHILPQAKERALQLGHRKGAAYPWRTISGIECSGYFPAGTAQYHINADIAYGFIQHWMITEDKAFLMQCGAEVIWETARIWLEIGHFYKDGFHIHNVTGPDEYTAIVSNNYYTNAMAKYHLIWAVKIHEWLSTEGLIEDMEQVKTLLDKVNLSSQELQLMKKASEQMVFIYDNDLGLYAQDATFLSKPRWPFEQIEPNKAPLLLHFHPLTIYRYQVLKQADTVLAHMLLEDYADEDSMRHAFNYYEDLTTHDSSLSSCIYGIMASRCGYEDKAYDYFKESLQLDLLDTHGNTKDGLHMANMAGGILSVTSGFAGLRIHEDGLSLKPNKPKSWTSFAFKMKYKGRLLHILIAEDTQVTLLEGNPLNIKIWDQEVLVAEEKQSIKGFVFDLDGVLTDTSHAHYLAWRDLALELGFDVPPTFEDEVRGISRLESLDMLLKQIGLEKHYTVEEKIALATQKNERYLMRIADYTQKDLAVGVLPLLKALKEKNYRLALASASNNAPFLLKAMEIDAFFDVVVDPKTIEKGKPSPDIFLKACQMIALKPETCIGIEDAFAGIESIKAAGMTAYGIGNSQILKNCQHIFEDLDQVHQHLIRLGYL